MNVFEYVFQRIDGVSMPLETYKGQPLLIVNTASECGYTPQLTRLQNLYRDFRQSGLVVIGIPCDDFGGQEPGDEETIAAFYSDNHGVQFPLTRKHRVIGHGAHPLFHELRDTYGDDIMPKWNFNKYLFGGNGDFIAHWPAATMPDDPLVTREIQKHLNSWVF